MSNLAKKLLMLGSAFCLTAGLGVFAACDTTPPDDQDPATPPAEETPVADNIISFSKDTTGIDFSTDITLAANTSTTYAFIYPTDLIYMIGYNEDLEEDEESAVTVTYNGETKKEAFLLRAKANEPAVITISATAATEVRLSVNTTEEENLAKLGENTATVEAGGYKTLIYEATADGVVTSDNSDIGFYTLENESSLVSYSGGYLYSYVPVEKGDLVVFYMGNYSGSEDAEFEFTIGEQAVTALSTAEKTKVTVPANGGTAIVSYTLTAEEIARAKNGGDNEYTLSFTGAEDTEVLVGYTPVAAGTDNAFAVTLTSYASETPVETLYAVIINPSATALTGVELTLTKTVLPALTATDGKASVTLEANTYTDYEYAATADGMLMISTSAENVDIEYNATSTIDGAYSFLEVKKGQIVPVTVTNNSEEAVTAELSFAYATPVAAAFDATTKVSLEAGEVVFLALEDTSLVGYNATSLWDVTYTNKNVMAFAAQNYTYYPAYPDMGGNVAVQVSENSYSVAYVILVNSGTEAVTDLEVKVANAYWLVGKSVTATASYYGTDSVIAKLDAGKYVITSDEEVVLDNYGNQYVLTDTDEDGVYEVTLEVYEDGTELTFYVVVPIEGEPYEVTLTINEAPEE